MWLRHMTNIIFLSKFKERNKKIKLEEKKTTKIKTTKFIQRISNKDLYYYIRYQLIYMRNIQSIVVISYKVK